MKDYPLLFTDEMVRAILEGRKTQMRRPCKPQPTEENGDILFPWASFFANGTVHTWDRNGVGGENWNVKDHPGENKFSEALKRTQYVNATPFGGPGDRLTVRECWPGTTLTRHSTQIRLPVTDVRVGRIQDISEAEACAEGVMPLPDNDTTLANYLARRSSSRHKAAFTFLWDAIYADKGLGWDDNPWVFAGTFKAP
jgi:hypothetical protein